MPDAAVAPSTSAAPVVRADELVCVRCWKCRHKLLRIEPDALSLRKKLEVKCNSCKTLNYLIGATQMTGS